MMYKLLRDLLTKRVLTMLIVAGLSQIFVAQQPEARDFSKENARPVRD